MEGNSFVERPNYVRLVNSYPLFSLASGSIKNNCGIITVNERSKDGKEKDALDEGE
jgi:hypothetical protein